MLYLYFAGNMNDVHTPFSLENTSNISSTGKLGF